MRLDKRTKCSFVRRLQHQTRPASTVSNHSLQSQLKLPTVAQVTHMPSVTHTDGSWCVGKVPRSTAILLELGKLIVWTQTHISDCSDWTTKVRLVIYNTRLFVTMMFRHFFCILILFFTLQGYVYIVEPWSS